MKQESQADAYLRKTKWGAIALFATNFLMMLITTIGKIYGNPSEWSIWVSLAISTTITIWLIIYSIKSIKKSEQ